MASFCTKCGARLNEGQAFCAACGTPKGASTPGQSPATAAAPPTAPSAAPPAAAMARPVVAPAAAASSGSGALVKILLAVVAVCVLIGAIGIVSVAYVGYRVRKKAHEMGINSHTFEQHASTLRGVDACRLLSKEDVSQAIGAEVVGTESERGENPSCAYRVKGTAADLTAKHLSLLQKEHTDKSQQQMVENIAKGIFRGSGGDQGDSSGDHADEAVALAFNINDNNAQLGMKLNRGALGGISPVGVVNIPDLGDEAFDAGGAMLMIRKGDKLVSITYTACPCTRDDILPLARKLVSNL